MGRKAVNRRLFFLAAVFLVAGRAFPQKASLIVQTGHFKDITCLEWSPDAKFVASGGKDHALFLYDAGTALQMASFDPFAGQLYQVGFSSDSKKVMGLSNGQGDKKIIFALFDIAKNDTVYTIRYDEELRNSPREFRLSYDQKLLAMRDGEEFFIYDLGTGKFLDKIDLGGDANYDINEHWQFMHDNKHLLCEDEENGQLLVIDLASKSVSNKIEAEVKKMGTSAAELGILTADDHYYYRCREPEKWYKYDLTNGSLVNETTPDDADYGSPEGCYATADGKTMLMNDLGLLYFFDVETGKKKKVIDHSSKGSEFVALSRDGKRIVMAVYNDSKGTHGNNTIADLLFVDYNSGRITRRFSGTPMRPTRVIFSNNSKNISITCNMPYKVWNLQTADGVKSLPDDTKLDYENLETVKFSPDDQVLFTGSEVHPDLVNLPTLEMKKYDEHFYFNYDVKGAGGVDKWINPDNGFEKIILGSSLYKMATGEFMCHFDEKDTPNEAHRMFTPDGKYAVIFSENGAKKEGVRVYVYSTEDCKKVADYEVPIIEHNHFEDYRDENWAFTRDSKRFAIVNKEYTLVDLLTGKIVVQKMLWDHKGGPINDIDPKAVSFNGDDSQVAVANADNTVIILEASTGKVLHILKGHLDIVNSVCYSPNGKLLASSGEDGRVILWDPVKGQQLATFIGLDSTDYIVTTPDNYYMSTKKGLKGVGFRVGNKMFPVEQFDLRQNRPDTVLRRMSVAANFLIKMYGLAWQKRVKKAGFTPEMLSGDFHVPELEIEQKLEIPLTTADTKLKFKVNMLDSLYPLERYNVYVNNVPLYGSRGVSLKGKNLKKLNTEVSLDLCSGANTVVVSVFNARGAESTRETFDIFCEKEGPKPNLYILAIGVSEYSDATHNLKFAAKDAGDFVNALKTGNSGFGTVNTKLILNKDAVLGNISGLRSFFANTKPDDQVIVYFSGHGLLDDKLDYYLALNNVDFNTPSINGLPYDLLESLIDSVPARNRLVFIDACHSGEVDKEDLVVENRPNTQVVANARSGNKVVKPKAGLKNSFDYMNALFSDMQRGSGASVISAAGGLEFALESKDWNNGIFTYSIINGLKNKEADLDKDGKVRLSELKKYVSETVFELTQGKQNPTMRKENAGNDFIIYEQ